MTFDHVWQLVEAFNRRFPDGNTPFQLISRLAEECGELAEQVNIAGFIGMLLLLMMDVLTDGKSLDAAIQFGIFMGLLFSIVPILQAFLYWLLRRCAK